MNIQQINKAKSWIKRSKKGTLLIAGPISSGKTTLIREICQGRRVVNYLSVPRQLEQTTGNVLVFEDIDPSDVALGKLLKKYEKKLNIPVICSSTSLTIAGLRPDEKILLWRPSAKVAASVVPGSDERLATRFDCDVRQMKIAMDFGDGISEPDKSRLSIPDAVRLAFRGKGVIEDIGPDIIHDKYLSQKNVKFLKIAEAISMADIVNNNEVTNSILEYGLFK